MHFCGADNLRDDYWVASSSRTRLRLFAGRCCGFSRESFRPKALRFGLNGKSFCFVILHRLLCLLSPTQLRRCDSSFIPYDHGTMTPNSKFNIAKSLALFRTRLQEKELCQYIRGQGSISFYCASFRRGVGFVRRIFQSGDLPRPRKILSHLR